MDEKERTYKELNIYFDEEFYAKLIKESKAANISVNSLISWLLFRGCIDWIRDNSVVNKCDVKQNEVQKKLVHLRISNKIHDVLNRISHKENGLKISGLISQVAQMEYEKMNGYSMIRHPKTREKNRYKEIRIKVNPGFHKQLEDMAKFTNIKITNLVPLMLAEYLTILNHGQYELPKKNKQ